MRTIYRVGVLVFLLMITLMSNLVRRFGLGVEGDRPTLPKFKLENDKALVGLVLFLFWLHTLESGGNLSSASTTQGGGHMRIRQVTVLALCLRIGEDHHHGVEASSWSVDSYFDTDIGVFSPSGRLVQLDYIEVKLPSVRAAHTVVGGIRIRQEFDIYGRHGSNFQQCSFILSVRESKWDDSCSSFYAACRGRARIGYVECGIIAPHQHLIFSTRTSSLLAAVVMLYARR